MKHESDRIILCLKLYNGVPPHTRAWETQQGLAPSASLTSSLSGLWAGG